MLEEEEEMHYLLPGTESSPPSHFACYPLDDDDTKVALFSNIGFSQLCKLEPCDKSRKNDIFYTGEQYDIRAGVNIRLLWKLPEKVDFVSLMVNHGELSSEPLRACQSPNINHPRFPQDQDYMKHHVFRAYINQPNEADYLMDQFKNPCIRIRVAENDLVSGEPSHVVSIVLNFLCLSTEDKSYGSQELLKKWVLHLKAKVKGKVAEYKDRIPIQVLRYPRGSKQGKRRKRTASAAFSPSSHLDAMSPASIASSGCSLGNSNPTWDSGLATPSPPTSDLESSVIFGSDLPHDLVPKLCPDDENSLIPISTLPDGPDGLGMDTTRKLLLAELVSHKRKSLAKDLAHFSTLLNFAPISLLRSMREKQLSG